MMHKFMCFQQGTILLTGVIAVSAGGAVQQPVQGIRPRRNQGVQAPIDIYPTFGDRQSATKVYFDDTACRVWTDSASPPDITNQSGCVIYYGSDDLHFVAYFLADVSGYITGIPCRIG